MQLCFLFAVLGNLFLKLFSTEYFYCSLRRGFTTHCGIHCLCTHTKKQIQCVFIAAKYVNSLTKYKSLHTVDKCFNLSKVFPSQITSWPRKYQLFSLWGRKLTANHFEDIIYTVKHGGGGSIMMLILLFCGGKEACRKDGLSNNPKHTIIVNIQSYPCARMAPSVKVQLRECAKIY